MTQPSSNRCLLSTVALLATCYCSDGFVQQFRGKHVLKHRLPIYYHHQHYLTKAITKEGISRSDGAFSTETTVALSSDETTSFHLPFTPWPHQVVESRGDYREEAYLEQLIGGQLYENNNNKTLPNLPVPTLKRTLERFIPTALPLCESEEERRSLIDACEKFEEQAKELQIRLLQRKKDLQDSSWLQQWWNQRVYLQVRDPVAVHVSYFLSIDDDPTLPTLEDLENDDGNQYLGATKSDVLRGASAIIAAAKVRKQVCSGLLPYDKIADKPLCSTGYHYLFHSCRIPRKVSDSVRIYDPASAKHCIVACKGYFFAVDFVDDQANPLPIGSLIKRLLNCQKMAQENELFGVPKAVGWLSGCDRDLWAESRNKLTQYKSFEEALRVLESGAFVLCLDEVLPKTKSDASTLFWNGKGGLGCNRCFDKSINIIVNGRGEAAILAEHSMMDGSIPMALCHQIQRDKYARLDKAIPPESESHVKYDNSIEDDSGVRDVFSECWSDAALTSLIHQLGDLGSKQYQKLTDTVELKTILHTDYGKQFIKNGKVSPDAFMQLVLQLAAFRCFGKQIATYEATQTRQFIHGRTETSRTVSIDSKAFVEAMGTKSSMSYKNDINAKNKLLKLLRQAADSHHEYTVSAVNGNGVDRHFLGLSLVLIDGEEPPDLFKDPVFIRSKTWRLSTSGLPNCPGFGAVVADGLGVGYGLRNDSCLFHVTSRRENKIVDKFCGEVVLALKEMKGLLETNNEDALAQ